ncbi:MAG: exopolysaccharide biosynthesis protein [Woeseia sp.]|nr:exopolysaccharide biosynthesis protein [Woeseia sp.]|tara:strand:- start:1019 stop:1804 length:786 start_codon:yes stop_codon:yes gene_type:complete
MAPTETELEEKITDNATLEGERMTFGTREDPLGNNDLQHLALNREMLNMNRIITVDSDPSTRTSYKMLRTRLLQNMRTNDWRSLAVTSAAQGEGKTLTAINLAISMAGDVNHKVCLVDLDMRHSSVASYLHMKVKRGISHCLKGKASLDDALVRTSIDRLFVLPNLGQEENTSELLSSPAMRNISDQFSSNPNNIVIYDMPPVLAADDMLAFAPLVDAVLLVVTEGKTQRTDAMRMVELLGELNVIGTVLNRSDERTAAYY